MTLRTNLVITRESDGAYKFNYGNLVIYCKDQGGTIKHRVGKAAYFCRDREEWWQDGKLHNLNGPAIVQPFSKNKSYYLFGKRMNKSEHKKISDEIKCQIASQIFYQKLLGEIDPNQNSIVE